MSSDRFLVGQSYIEQQHKKKPARLFAAVAQTVAGLGFMMRDAMRAAQQFERALSDLANVRSVDSLKRW
jgi:hypothetical protein